MAEMEIFFDRLKRAIAPRFELTRVLEESAGALDALARQPADGKLVTLHALELARGSPIDPERLAVELARRASVVHEHLLEVLEVGRRERLVWIALPYLEGAVSLRTWLEREKRLPFLEAVRVLRECAQALAHAHAQGSLHLDLRPELVLWSDTHVRLQGLGLRQSLLAAGLAPQPSDREGAGTDLLALGALGYEILVGEPPLAVARAPSPARRRAHMPPGLARLIVRCLARDPRDRPRDMREASRLLEGLVTPVVDWNAQVENQARFLCARGREAEAAERRARAARVPPQSGCG